MSDGDRDDKPENMLRMGLGSLTDILGSCLGRATALDERRARECAELDAHRAECRAHECRTCGRAKCWRCQQTHDQAYGLCRPCRDRESFERAKSDVFESVPVRFRWAIDASVEQIAARVKYPHERIERALAWVRTLDASPPNVSLVGAPGAGKTSLVVALFSAWFDKHRVALARFVPAYELALSRTRHPLGKDEAPEILAAVSAPLLVLDDLGAESARVSDVISFVMHARHNANRPTWTTTGLDHDELVRRYDGGVARRVFEHSKLVKLGCDGVRATSTPKPGDT